MIFGTTDFYCADCHNVFRSLAVEYNCSCFFSPMKCTKCGSWHTAPAGSPFVDTIYKDIWAQNDKNGRTKDAGEHPIIAELVEEYEQEAAAKAARKAALKRLPLWKRLFIMFK